MAIDARAKIIIEAVAQQAIAEMARVSKATQELNKQSQIAAKRQQQLTKMATRAGLALTAFAVAGGAALFSATRLAARVETLGVVTRQLGKNAGFSAEQITRFEKSVKAQGITLRSTRESMALMMQSQVDLTHATDLARMAQDAAVIANVNSSEAFRRLVFVITSGNTRMARTLGLQVSFQNAYKRTAEELGIATDALTRQQKVQARTNEVLRAGTTIVGTYSAAMTTAGKKVLSLDRHIEESRRIIGELFLPAFADAVDIVTKFLKTFEAATEAQKRGTAAAIATTVAIAGITGVTLLAVKGVIALKGAVLALGTATALTTAGLSLLAAALAALAINAVKHKQATEGLKEDIAAWNKEMKDGTITLNDWKHKVLLAAEGTSLYGDAMVEWNEIGREFNSTGETFNDILFRLVNGLDLAEQETVELTGGIGGLLVGTQEWIDAMEEGIPAVEGLTGATEDAAEELTTLAKIRIRALTKDAFDASEAFGALTQSIGGTIESYLNLAAFAAAGGTQLQAMAESIVREYDDGNISLDEMNELMGNVQTAVLEVQEEIGLIDTKEAQERAKEWGVSFDEGPKKSVMEIFELLAQMTSKPWTIDMEVNLSGDRNLTNGGRRGGAGQDPGLEDPFIQTNVTPIPEDFAHGGIVGGPIGAPQLAVVHGGEKITPPGITNNIGEGMTINISVGEDAGQIDFQEAVEDALREILD